MSNDVTVSGSGSRAWPSLEQSTPELEPLLHSTAPQAAQGVLAELHEIREAVTQLADNYLKLNVSNFPVVDCKGLARVLGKSESTIRRWTEDKVIPCYKIPAGDQKFTYLYNLKRVAAEFDDEYSQEATS